MRPPAARPARSATRKVGLISDTHGLVRPQVHEALRGVEFILHAGDVGGDEVLDELALIAPIHAVYGNTDDIGNPRLSAAIDMVVVGISIHVSHGHELGVPKPEKLLARYASDVIVYGHTHQQLVTRADDRLVVNPGAAGPARFDLEPSVAMLEITGATVDVRVISLA